VQRQAAAGAGPDVAGRPGFGPTETRRDLHDRTVADVPVEEVAVEVADAVGVQRLDLPVHHRAGPVVGRRHAPGIEKSRTGRSGGACIGPVGCHPLVAMSSMTWAMLRMSSS